MRLLITETDAAGDPILDRILLDGPTIVNPSGDGVTPTPFVWQFEPPVSLPGAGTYAFFLSQRPCAAYFDVLSTGEDAGLYPEGIIFLSGRTAGCDLSSGYVDRFPRADLIFRMEFCTDAATPAKRRSWGELKILYR